MHPIAPFFAAHLGGHNNRQQSHHVGNDGQGERSGYQAQALPPGWKGQVPDEDGENDRYGKAPYTAAGSRNFVLKMPCGIDQLRPHAFHINREDVVAEGRDNLGYEQPQVKRDGLGQGPQRNAKNEESEWEKAALQPGRTPCQPHQAINAGEKSKNGDARLLGEVAHRVNHQSEADQPQAGCPELDGHLQKLPAFQPEEHQDN